MPVIRKKHAIPLAVIILMAAAVITAVWFFARPGKTERTEYKIDRSGANAHKLADVASLYTEYDNSEVAEIYLTTFEGVDEETGELFDLGDLNEINSVHDGDPAIRSIIKIRDGKGGYILGGDTSKPNCFVMIRGQSARRADRKSYQIKIFDGAGSFHGQTVLNLNKNESDITKIKNKLCYDIISRFPDMISMRTSFVHLYVMDADENETTYTDYGLFTQIEQPNKAFLRAHGLDPSGTLYKPSDFEFLMHDEILPEDDPGYDYNLFSKRLKIRENSDNKKLLGMMRDVNDYTLDFKEVFDKYFDIDNYLTWIAMNLLLDNYDTASRNFLLYSPSYSNKWYYMPWDYDKVLLSEQERARGSLYHFFGIERYWGTVLHNRFFRDPDNLKLLDAKIEKLYAILTDKTTQKFINAYRPIAKKYLSKPPDSIFYEGEYDRALAGLDSIEKDIRENRRRYYQSKERPMPFFQGTPKLMQNGKYYFNWDASYDFQGDSISYTIKIGRSVDMRDIVFTKSGLYETEVTIDQKLPPGEYFWTVTAKDSKGNEQTAFEYIKIGSKYFHGVKRLQIK